MNITKMYSVLSALVAGMFLLNGCTSVNTFPAVARAGDTTVISAGWKHYFSRDNITVTIMPPSGFPITYLPGDPAIRSVINLYPDPVSSLVISREIGQDLSPNARTWGETINNVTTAGDSDWWQTTVFVDLPTSLPLGITTVDITTPEGEFVSSTVEIVDGLGAPDDFQSRPIGLLSSQHFQAMERTNHFVVMFDGATIPHAIQADMTHDPDEASGGVGVPYVINTRGDLKNIAWRDDGANLRVMLTPSGVSTPTHIKTFKFYVAGGITGLVASNVNVAAFDINGNPVSGVTVSVTAGN